MGNVTLVLGKEDETQNYMFSDDLKGLSKAVKNIQRLLKEKWQLIDCSGDNASIVYFIKKQIDSYNQNPKDYKVPIKETLTTVKTVTGVSTKQIMATGKQAIKHKILHPFQKNKKEAEKNE